MRGLFVNSYKDKRKPRKPVTVKGNFCTSVFLSYHKALKF